MAWRGTFVVVTSKLLSTYLEEGKRGGGGGGRWGEDDQNMSIENPEKENEYIRHNFLRTSEQGGHSPSQHRRLQAWRSQSLNL